MHFACILPEQGLEKLKKRAEIAHFQWIFNAFVCLLPEQELKNLKKRAEIAHSQWFFNAFCMHITRARTEKAQKKGRNCSLSMGFQCILYAYYQSKD